MGTLSADIMNFVCYANELIREGKILGSETRIKRDIRDYLYAPISKFRRKLASVPDVWSVQYAASLSLTSLAPDSRKSVCHGGFRPHQTG
jgi:hypothetical protein